MDRVVSILLIDDNSEMRSSLRAILEDCPRTRIVAEAFTIDEALLHIEAVNPSVVIIDITFPVLDGIAATRLITTNYPHIVVIGLSTNPTDYLMHAMMNAGGHLLQKDKAPDDLCSYIQDTIVSAQYDNQATPSLHTSSNER